MADPETQASMAVVADSLLGAWMADFSTLPEPFDITEDMRPWSFAQIFDSDGDSNEASPPPAPTAVGLVYVDSGSVYAEAWNELANEGLLRAATDFSIVPKLYESSGDHASALQQCADDGNVICLNAAGWQMADATLMIAEANPETFFVSIDQSWEDYPDNLRGVLFKADEVGYLAGTLAGLMTDSNAVGVIGGWEGVLAVEEFVYGYRNGAQCVNSEAEVLVDYTDDFSNPGLGRAIATGMVNDGVADVIFAPAGFTGTGSALTATELGAWAIGVDTDWYLSVFENGGVTGSELLLTSAMKRLDTAVYMAVEDWFNGAFTTGTIRYGLAEGGVGLADYHQASSAISDNVKATVQSVEHGIIDETIDVSEPCGPP
jgi:basic membrane protein A